MAVPEEMHHVSGSRRAADKRAGTSGRQRIEAALEGAALVWDSDQLRGLAIVSTILDELIDREVASRRGGEDGASWAEVGASLGISKQAAQQRYGVKSS